MRGFGVLGKFSTEAVQITFVSPNSTNTDPAACFVNCLVKLTFLNSLLARPLGRMVTPARLAMAAKGKEVRRLTQYKFVLAPSSHANDMR